MKLARTVLFGLAFAAALAATDPEADLSGVWIGEIPSPGDNRPPTQMGFVFEQSGAKLTGKQYGDFRDVESAPILDGVVAGDRIEFAVERREQVGNLIHIIRYEYDGAIRGLEIELTSEKASARDAVNGAPAAVRRPDDTREEDRKRRFTTFRIERLY